MLLVADTGPCDEAVTLAEAEFTDPITEGLIEGLPDTRDVVGITPVPSAPTTAVGGGVVVVVVDGYIACVVKS